MLTYWALEKQRSATHPDMDSERERIPLPGLEWEWRGVKARMNEFHTLLFKVPNHLTLTAI